MWNRSVLFLALTVVGSCGRPPSTTSSPPRNAPVNIQAVASSWRYPGAAIVSGGSTVGLYHALLSSEKSYAAVWSYYAKRIGFPGELKPNARGVGSDCSSRPEGCEAYGLETHDSPGMRAASFAHRSKEGGVVVFVSRPDSADSTNIQLTITAP